MKLKYTIVPRDHRETFKDVEKYLKEAYAMFPGEGTTNKQRGRSFFDFERGIDDSYCTFIGDNKVIYELDYFQLYSAYCAVMEGVELEGFSEEDGLVCLEGKSPKEMVMRLLAASEADY